MLMRSFRISRQLPDFTAQIGRRTKKEPILCEWALIHPAPRVGGIGGWVRDAGYHFNDLNAARFRPGDDIFTMLETM